MASGGRPHPDCRRRARSVSTRVLPDPAGAITRAAARGSPTAASWSGASGTPLGVVAPIGVSDPCSKPMRCSVATPTRPATEASSGPPSQIAGRPSGRTTSARPDVSVRAPSATAWSAQWYRAAPSRASTELAHRAWCSLSLTRSRSNSHSHGWRPTIGSAGGASGRSSPRPGASSTTRGVRARHAAPMASAVATSTFPTASRSHPPQAAGAGWPGRTTTKRPKRCGSGTTPSSSPE